MVNVNRKLHFKSQGLSKQKVINYRSFKYFDSEEFQSILSQAPWHVFNDVTNVDDYWLKWKNIFISIAHRLAPMKKLRVRNDSAFWIDSNLRKLMSKRDKAYKKCLSVKHEKLNTSKESEFDQLWSSYKSLRNEVNISLRNSKSEYFKAQLRSNSNDYKCMYTLIDP